MVAGTDAQAVGWWVDPFITVGWVAPLVRVDDDCILSFGVALTARRIHMAWAKYS